MDDAIEPARVNLPYGGRYSLALFLSVAFHALLLWLAGHYLLDADTDSQPANPGILHLKLSPVKSSHPEPAAQEAPKLPSSPDKAVPSRQDSTAARSGESTPAGNAVPRGQITARRILATARELANKLAAREVHETKPETLDVGTVLDRALHPKREPPGVSSLADGTIRVVTDGGLVYCIRPNSDPGIIDPQDIMPVSVLCN